MISARALGVYVFLLGHSKSISAEVLAKEFKEGRNAMLTALKELRDKGLIKTHRYSINGSFATKTEIVDQSLIPNETLKKLRKITSSTSKRILPQNTPNSGKYVESSTEQDDFIEKNFVSTKEYITNGKTIYDEKLREYDDRRTAKITQQNLSRHQIPKISWKPKHVCQEFSNRIWTMHIKPWNVNASDFVKAMGTTRNKYGTDGEVELRVMELFFVRIDLSKYSEPEHLWRLFLKMFPTLLSTVRLNQIASKSIKDSAEEDDKYWTERGL